MTVTITPTTPPTIPAHAIWIRMVVSSKLLLLEQPQVDDVRHRLVSRIVHVQVVARVELRLNSCRCVRIADGRVEVDDAVVGFAGPDPLVDRLSLGFAF